MKWLDLALCPRAEPFFKGRGRTDPKQLSMKLNRELGAEGTLVPRQLINEAFWHSVSLQGGRVGKLLKNLRPPFFSRDASAYFYRGVAYGGLGNYRQKIEDYKIAARLGFEPAQDYLRSKGISW